jgi:hypothetical protein
MCAGEIPIPEIVCLISKYLNFIQFPLNGKKQKQTPRLSTA